VASDGAHQAVKESGGESAACLAVSGIGEVDFGEVTQFLAGGIAVENLLEEQIGGDSGSEGALAEGVAEVAADAQGEGFGDGLGEVALDVEQGLRDSRDSGLLFLMVDDSISIMAEGRFFSKASRSLCQSTTYG